ncbi:NADH-quinone oxidoreductase subunit J [Fundidesulfovibrio magnetotacticus]|uniref:NADH-quinone oxidoreductase subunit J n=1 Tax=Fundidesulfovibrio magnetotacticus TaxID=2730080 RepID=A0A6V8LI88_9BACT|nr:NADH-quinone oxidoreductase subunit J [Fundidesulfovibrio magnetotacticus]GFK92452.1 NADH-quinone oxidoreductase subunit J [Fundidesulfovibrio magnetotacticus]
MSLTQFLFYPLAAVIAVSTALAVTRREPVHAVVYLVVSFFATAVLFALLGAPLVAVLQIMVPAGAVMVLFLFVIMLLGSELSKPRPASPFRWGVPAILALAVAVCGLLLLSDAPEAASPLAMAKASARELGTFVYEHYWPAVEGISVLFFVALAGACFLVKDFRPAKAGEDRP